MYSGNPRKDDTPVVQIDISMNCEEITGLCDPTFTFFVNGVRTHRGIDVEHAEHYALNLAELGCTPQYNINFSSHEIGRDDGFRVIQDMINAVKCVPKRSGTRSNNTNEPKV
jgi:hypothetical protein